MNAAPATSAMRAVPLAPPPSSTSSTAADAASLLPDPAAGALASGDPLSLLYLFESRDQDASTKEGSDKVASLQSQRNQSLQKERDAWVSCFIFSIHPLKKERTTKT